MADNVDCNVEEDEDVVIAGSELHEALSKMGYSDYEIVPIVSNNEPSASEDGNKSRQQKSSEPAFGVFYNKLWDIYRSMIKDSEALGRQLLIISEAQHILDDHVVLIQSLFEKDRIGENNGGIKYLLSYLKYAGIASVGYYLISRSSNRLIWLTTLPALMTARLKYRKWRASRDLKKLISEQTELHYMYKRALRILNHSFRMNTGPRQSGFQFTDLGAEKLKFLQPITEKTVGSLSTMSFAYYETTLRMFELLPDSYRRDLDSQITYFDKECFTNYGEITYNSLKQLFYRFILIQSEMLLTLAILCQSQSNDFGDEMKREIKIDRRIQQLLQLTTNHRISMMKIVDNFQKHKPNAVEIPRRGFPGSKWHDLYVRLHLTSYKIEKAYDNIASALKDIENHIDRETDEGKLFETLKLKLDSVFDDVDKAKNLALLSSLIISKMGKSRDDGRNQNGDGDNETAQISRQNIPVVRDTEPEINDEVFEEYIRERYSETSCKEDGDDYLERIYKLDKLLSKNLMSELKEALIDKQIDTREREAKALKRMNKNFETESNTNDCERNGDPSSDPGIVIESNNSKGSLELESSRNEAGDEKQKFNYMPMPPPPPMPKKLISPREEPLVEIKSDELELNCSFPMPSRIPMTRKIGQFRGEVTEIEKVEDRVSQCSVSLPAASGSIMPVPLFLSNNEETFIGSGENSDEESFGRTVESEEENEGAEKEG